jgi:hypothetical protein
LHDDRRRHLLPRPTPPLGVGRRELEAHGDARPEELQHIRRGAPEVLRIVEAVRRRRHHGVRLSC